MYVVFLFTVVYYGFLRKLEKFRVAGIWTLTLAIPVQRSNLLS